VTMADVDWNARARQGVGFQSVIDPGDVTGLKNELIDRIQWGRIEPWLRGRRSLLDFGCGVGRFAARVMQRGAGYVGTDASSAMIDCARQLHAGSAAQFLHVADLPLPFDAAQFDGCLTVGVLQCLKTADNVPLRAALAELARVLAPGGQLLMIEQASASGRHSGSVAEAASEQDYLDALSNDFSLVEVTRLRLGALSRLSSVYTRRGSGLPFRHAINGWLARRETAAASLADDATLNRLAYYDVAICATRRVPG
jgi:SAM-dependent methyltransferase